MKSFLKYLGLALIFLGTAAFVALHVFHITFVNKLMAIPMILILVGTILFVWMMKRQSSY